MFNLAHIHSVWFLLMSVELPGLYIFTHYIYTNVKRYVIVYNRSQRRIVIIYSLNELFQLRAVGICSEELHINGLICM